MQWHTLANAQSLLLGSASWSGWGYLGCLMFSILDEAAASLSDPPPCSMTSGAQQALRRTMELYSNTTRFALACNTSSKVRRRCGWAAAATVPLPPARWPWQQLGMCMLVAARCSRHLRAEETPRRHKANSPCYEQLPNLGH